VVDQEVEMHRGPVAAGLSHHGPGRALVDLHDPESLRAELRLGPIALVLDDREAEAAAIELDRTIHVVDVDADLELHGAGVEHALARAVHLGSADPSLLAPRELPGRGQGQLVHDLELARELVAPAAPAGG